MVNDLQSGAKGKWRLSSSEYFEYYRRIVVKYQTILWHRKIQITLHNLVQFSDPERACERQEEAKIRLSASIERIRLFNLTVNQLCVTPSKFLLCSESISFSTSTLSGMWRRGCPKPWRPIDSHRNIFFRIRFCVGAFKSLRLIKWISVFMGGTTKNTRMSNRSTNTKLV